MRIITQIRIVMFSRKIGVALGVTILFLTFVAFIIGRPETRDKRVYPEVRKYMPFEIQKSLGGLRILRKDDPKFKEEPDAVNFYSRLQYLERDWAKTHLKLKGNLLEIFDKNQTKVKELKLKNSREIEFVKRYFGVDSE